MGGRSAKQTAKKAAIRGPRKATPFEPANLLVTIDEQNRDQATQEVLSLLSQAGYPNSKVVETPALGMIGVRVDCPDTRECIPRLKEVLIESPFSFHNTHRWIPVEAWAEAEAAELAKFAKLAGTEIGPEESWAINVERHGSDVDRELIVDALAKGIDNPHVSLDDPDKTVFVDVIGSKAALAVLDPSQKLSVDRSMRDDFVDFEEVARE